MIINNCMGQLNLKRFGLYLLSYFLITCTGTTNINWLFQVDLFLISRCFCIVYCNDIAGEKTIQYMGLLKLSGHICMEKNYIPIED